MRHVICLGLLFCLAGCAHPHPPESDSRADLLRPVTGSTQTGTGASSAPTGRKTHGHLYMGSGFGGNRL